MRTLTQLMLLLMDLSHECPQNQNETGVFDLLRLLLTFGADCRLKDAHGNNGTTCLWCCVSLCVPVRMSSKDNSLCITRLLYYALPCYFIQPFWSVHSSLMIRLASVYTSSHLFNYKCWRVFSCQGLKHIPPASLSLSYAVCLCIMQPSTL